MSTFRWLAVLVVATQVNCTSLECGDGTIEQGGTCVPADETIGSGACGPGTKLEGDQCVPNVVCDPTTTMAVTDPDTGAVTCVAIGTGCGEPITCPPPASGTQTVCGQIFDLDDQSAFAAGGAMGSDCGSGATDGPCVLSMQVFDAQEFVADPTTAQPLPNDGITIDDCGRFRIDSVQVPGTTVLLGLGFDDAAATDMGPGGVTNAVGIAVPKEIGQATQGVEGYIASSTTTDAWAASGGPAIGDGIYVDLFRAHLTGLGGQAGVTVTKGAATIHPNDFYFTADEQVRETVDTTSQMTGVNGAALLVHQNGLGYAGTGGLADGCAWEQHIAASVPNIVFVQVTRPTDASGKTCAQ
jgi:hypothetical protein